MPDPVNLNQFRKAKARADDRAKADENAIRFGRSKARKQRDKALKAKAARLLDGHKRTP